MMWIQPENTPDLQQLQRKQKIHCGMHLYRRSHVHSENILSTWPDLQTRLCWRLPFPSWINHASPGQGRQLYLHTQEYTAPSSVAGQHPQDSYSQLPYLDFPKNCESIRWGRHQNSSLRFLADSMEHDHGSFWGFSSGSEITFLFLQDLVSGSRSSFFTQNCTTPENTRSQTPNLSFSKTQIETEAPGWAPNK